MPARLVFGVRACEVGHRLEVVLPLDARDQLERLVSGRPAVGDRDPVGRVAGQGSDRLLEEVDLALVARSHELE